MGHPTPTVTPDRGSTLAMDDTGPDVNAAGNGGASPDPEEVSTDTTSTLPPPEPKAAVVSQPKAGLKFTANASDMVEVGAMLYQEAEALLRSGPKKRIKIRLGRRTIAEMPLSAGAVGVMVAAMAAVALSRLTVDIE